MKARSFFTPRANPHETSLSNLIKPTADGYVPRNMEKAMYEGPDVHNPCYDLPANAVDVLAIVSGRRRRLSTEYNSAQGASKRLLISNNETLLDRSATTLTTTPIIERQVLDDDDAIVPGLGWQVVDEPPGDCNGEYNSICGRHKGNPCPLIGHHDYRGVVIGNEWAGWLVLELPDVTEGIIVMKIVTYMNPAQNTRTNGWTSVNNKEGKRRRLEDSEAEPPARLLVTLTELPDEFMFDYAINGKITSLNKAEFIDFVKKPQRVVEFITVLDDPDFTTEPTNVEVAFRMRNCGRQCTFALSHVYWA
jgi:hypothetical protein